MPKNATSNRAAQARIDINVLGLIASGARDRDIANRIGVSVDCAKRRVRALMSQFGANNRAEVAARAVLEGWLDQRTLQEIRSKERPK